jgi:hypothetical protein
MGEGNRFIALRSSLLDAQGSVRTDIFKPRGDIHLNALGNQIVSLRIRQVLEIMLPSLVQTPVQAPVQTPPAPVPSLAQAPAVAKRQRPRVQAPVQDEVQAPVVVNEPPVVDTTLVAAVVNAPAVEQVQNVVPETPMEVEDEDALLQRLFFKKYGRALPEETEKEDEVDQIKFVIDLTKDEDEMEVATSEDAPVAVVKTEPIEISNVNNFANAKSVYNESGVRVSRRLELIELAKARKAITEFGKSLRKTDVIPEKEAPVENVIATDDTDMAEDVSVNEANSVNTIEMAEQVIAESDRRAERIIADSQEFAAEFGDTPLDEFDD